MISTEKLPEAYFKRKRIMSDLCRRLFSGLQVLFSKYWVCRFFCLLLIQVLQVEKKGEEFKAVTKDILSTLESKNWRQTSFGPHLRWLPFQKETWTTGRYIMVTLCILDNYKYLLKPWSMRCLETLLTVATRSPLHCFAENTQALPSPQCGSELRRPKAPRKPPQGPALAWPGHRWAGLCAVQSGSVILQQDLYLSLLSVGSDQFQCLKSKPLDKVRPRVLLLMHTMWSPAKSRDTKIGTKVDTTLQTVPERWCWAPRSSCDTLKYFLHHGKKTVGKHETCALPTALKWLWLFCPFSSTHALVLTSVPASYLLLPLPELNTEKINTEVLPVLHSFLWAIFRSISENTKQCTA